MCGIFGIISRSRINEEHLKYLATHSSQRGIDSSGLVFVDDHSYKVQRADYRINKLISNRVWCNSQLVMGHSRLVTNGLYDNQPVVKGDTFVIHNGIIVNDISLWDKLGVKREFEIDTEILNAITIDFLEKGGKLDHLPSEIFNLCKGTISAVIAIPSVGKLVLLSNNGSLFYGENGTSMYFSSERYPLSQLNCININQLINDFVVLDIPMKSVIDVKDFRKERKIDLIPSLKSIHLEEGLLEYNKPELKRCTKCILPETMPFISFDDKGVCNYCNNYKPRTNVKPVEELKALLEPYKRNGETDCIVPFSGGRDSSYALHYIVKELKMKPITYTYDWGMVTDLGRRNISRMCSELGVENIIIAADISKKREHIKKNLNAWLKSPHLGMISILTAGDKHFFKYAETVKKQTGVNLNLWGINPLEVTHFKSGFLGVKPDFEEKRVYMPGFYNQLRYHFLRFRAMTKSPGYFNDSLWDTLSGEFYRSFSKKEDYYHIFDYIKWDESIIDETLKEYDWELAPDTNTTWRIGDGTAAFYNYIYYTVAGFTEHDTFRSNQIREGQINREEAIRLVEDENRPRYQNIKWYLETLNMDFKEVIEIVNSIPKLYR